MHAELLLTWMSEVGSGDIRDVRQRIAWAARVADRTTKPYETGRWLRDISALGHAEIDWTNGIWSVAPAAAALLPECGGTAVLTGSRRCGHIDRLEGLDVAVHVERPTAAYERPLPMPALVYLQADSIDDLRTALEDGGIKYVGDAARNITLGLNQIALGAPGASPPRSDDSIEHLSPHAEAVRFNPGLPSSDGLCRITVHGRPSYRYRLDGAWYLTDHAVGILYDLAARGINVFRWRLERTSGSQEIGTVFVDQGAPLPPLQMRALVLCSGRPIEFGDNAHTAIYRNVPREIAQLVARSIRQQVVILP